MIELHFDKPSRVYRPGETIEVRANWKLAPHEKLEAETIELSCSWRTEGKGTTDEREIARTHFSTATNPPNFAWRFTLPAGPLSLDGQILKIIWLVHCEDMQGKWEIDEIFDVSYGSGPIHLAKVQKPM